ncbi:hypothetical protein HPB50_018344 [Hyalomma asiaticum]|uniref:Uncharacterized protein n=1 Tax=Hyalomma asiaticum TaxID=266040 RepID=A0ACB7RMY5_HYAAI|nr:hypothetical protein HPB50_018344 [Hyalomma asiaticum]
MQAAATSRLEDVVRLICSKCICVSHFTEKLAILSFLSSQQGGRRRDVTHDRKRTKITRAGRPSTMPTSTGETTSSRVFGQETRVNKSAAQTIPGRLRGCLGGVLVSYPIDTNSLPILP